MNRYWGRNSENTNKVNFYRTDNQISSLNIENLFDSEYTTKLFTPSDSNVYKKHSNNFYLEQEQRILQSNAQQQKGSTWYPTCDLPEEILLFGSNIQKGFNSCDESGSNDDDARLGYELILKHNTVYNIAPALKYPDMPSLLIYRQANVFSCIIDNIRNRLRKNSVPLKKINHEVPVEPPVPPLSCNVSKSAVMCSLKVISNHIKNTFASDVDWSVPYGTSSSVRLLVIKQISNMNTFLKMLWNIYCREQGSNIESLEGDLKGQLLCILQHGYIQLMLTYCYLSKASIISTDRNASFISTCKAREQPLLSVYGDLRLLLQVLSRTIHTMFCIFVASGNSCVSKPSKSKSKLNAVNSDTVPVMLMQLMLFIGHSNALQEHWRACEEGIAAELNGLRKQLLGKCGSAPGAVCTNKTAVPNHTNGIGKLACITPVGSVPISGNLNSIVPIKPSSGSGKQKPVPLTVSSKYHEINDSNLAGERDRELCAVPSPTGGPLHSLPGIGNGIAFNGGGSSPSQCNNDELLAFQLHLQANASAAAVAVATNTADEKMDAGAGAGNPKKVPTKTSVANKTPVIPTLVVGKPRSSLPVPVLPEKQPFSCTEVLSVNYGSAVTEPYLLLNKNSSGKNNVNIALNIQQEQEPNCDTELPLFDNEEHATIRDLLKYQELQQSEGAGSDSNLGGTSGSLDPSTDLDAKYVEIDSRVAMKTQVSTSGPISKPVPKSAVAAQNISTLQVEFNNLVRLSSIYCQLQELLVDSMKISDILLYCLCVDAGAQALGSSKSELKPLHDTGFKSISDSSSSGAAPIEVRCRSNLSCIPVPTPLALAKHSEFSSTVISLPTENDSANGPNIETSGTKVDKLLSGALASPTTIHACGQNMYNELGMQGDMGQLPCKTFVKVDNLSPADERESGENQSQSSLKALDALAGLNNHPIAGQIIQVGAGNEHSVFLTASGDVYAVGFNDNGQCGIGSNTPLRDVRKINGLTAGTDDKIAQIHVYNGCEHTLAISRSGKLYSFGYNYRGQLGNGTTISENVPRLVKGMIGKCVVLASCSYYHSILLCSDGTLWTMGRGDSGQLGHGDSLDSKVPRMITCCVRNGVVCNGAPPNITSMSCGQYHTVITTYEGDVYACGKNDFGQLGSATTDAMAKLLTRCNNESRGGTGGNQQSLLTVSAASGTSASAKMGSIKQACCGYYHTLFLTHTGIVWGCGRNDYGQLGLGHSQPRVMTPHAIPGLRDKPGVVYLAGGCYHSVAVCSNGMIYVCGRNNHGQLGTGDLEERHTPTAIDDFLGRRIESVAAGFYHTIILHSDANERGVTGDSSYNIVESTISECGVYSGHDFNSMYGKAFAKSCMPMVLPTAVTNSIEPDVGSTPPGAGASTAPPACSGRNGPLAPTCTLSHRLSCQVQHEQHRQQYQEQRQHRGSPDAGVACDYKLKCPSVDPSDAIFPCKSSDSMSCSENPLAMLVGSTTLMKTFLEEVVEKHCVGQAMEKSKSRGSVFSILSDELLSSKRKNLDDVCFNSSSDITLHHIAPFLLEYVGAEEPFIVGDGKGKEEGNGDTTGDNVVDKLIDIATYSNQVQWLTCSVRVLTALLSSIRSDIAAKTKFSDVFLSCDGGGSVESKVSCLSDLLRAIQQLLVRNQKLLLTVCSSTPACNCMHCASRIASESKSIADISASDSEPVTILGVLQMLSESRPISSASRTNGRETSSSSLICILKCAIVELRNQLTYTHLTADSTFCGIKSQELLDNILYGHLDSADSCDHCQLGCDPSLTKKRIAAHNDLDAVSPSSANTICNRISNIIVQNVSTLFVSTKSRLDHFEQLSNAIINICRCSLNYGSPNASDYGASELDSCSGVLVNFGQYLRLTIHFCFRYCTLKDIATLFKESVILGLKWFCVLIELFATLSQLCMQYKLYSVDSNNSMIQVLFSIYCGDIYKIMGVLDQHCLGNFTKVAVPLIFTEHCTEVSSVGMTILTKIFTASEGTLVDLLRHHQIGLVHKYYTCLEENALKEEAYAVDSVSAQLESDSYLTYTSLPKPSAGTMSEDPVLNILSFGTLLPNTLPSVLAIVMSFLVTPPPSELLHSTGTSSVNCGTISSSATGMLQTIVARLMIGNIESSEPRKCNVVELDVIEHKLHLMKSMLPLLDSLRNRILKLQRCWNDTRTALVNVVGYMGTLLTEGSESGSRSETPAEGEKVKNACVFISSTLQCAWCSRLLKLSIVTSSNIASILVLSHEISVIQNENESLSGSSEKIMKHPVWSYVSLPDREKDLMPNFGSLFCPVSDSMGMEATRKLYTSSDHVYNMLLKVAARSTTPMTVKIGMDTQVEPVTHLSIIHSIEGMIFDTVCMCEFGSCSLEGVNSVVSESQRSIMQLVKTQAWKGIAGIIKRMYSKRSAIISALQPKSDIGHNSAQESLDAPETGDDIYSTPTRKIRSLKDSSILYTHELSAESPSYFMSPILEANNKNRGTPDSCGLRHSITKSDEVVDSVTPCVKWGDILSIIHAIVKRVHFRLHETSGVLSLKYTFNTPLLPPVVFSKVYKYKSHWKRAFSLIVCCNRWRLLVKHSLRSSLTTSVVSFYDDCITETVYSSLMELETKRSDEAECAITAIEEKMIDSTYVSELVNESWKKNVEDVLDCGNRRCNHVAVGILEYCNLLNSDMNVGVLGAMGGSKSDVLVSLVETFRYKNELKLFAHHMVSNYANSMGTKVCVGDSSRKPCLIYALDRSCCSTLYEHSTYNFGCKQLVRMLQQGVTGVYDMNRPVNGGNNIAPLVIGFQYNNNDLVYVSLCLKALEVMSVYSYDALLSLNMPKLCVDIRGLFLLFEQLSSEALATTSAGAVSTNNNSSGDQENVSKNVSTAPPNVSQKSSASTSAVDLAPAGSPSAPRPIANGQPPASLPTQSREKKKLYRRVSSIIVSFLESLGVAVSYLSGLGGDQAVCQMYAKYLYEAQSVVISSLQKARAVPNNLFSADGSHGNPDANSLSVSQKKRCQTLISNPILFNKGADGFLIPEKSLISNNKGIDFTLVGWVYISKNGTSVSMNSASGKGVSFLFGRMQQNDCWPLLLLRPDMKLEVVYGKSVDLEKFSSNANIPANTWIHVAVTNEARKIKLYINGSLDCHVTVTGNPKAISMPLMIGACPQNIKTRVDYVREGFDGQLGNFKYHTRALTLIHVRILFEQGAPEVNDGRDKWLFQMLASSCLLCRVLRRCNNKVLELSGDVVQKNAHALLNLALSDGYSGSNGCGLLTSTPSSSGGIVMSSTSLGGSSSFTTSMCSSKLRVAALRGLEGILAINILNDIEISTCDLTQVSSSHDSTKSEDCCPIPAIDSQGNFELSTKLPGCSNPGDSSDSKRSPISLMTASFLLEYSTFHEKFVAFIFKLIGLCWLPSVISGTEVSSDLPASISKAKELSRFLGEHGDCFLEILVCAPKFIASSVFGRDSTTSSNTAGNGVVGSAIDKTVPREDLNSEFCHLMGSMLHALANNVKQGDSLWYNAISSVIEKMLTRCRTALNFRSQWNNSTMVIVDTLGISMFLGNMCTGLYLGCDIEGYFCDGVGKLLHVHPSNGTVTLLQPNRSHTRSQIVTVRLSDVAAALNCNNSASGSESGSLSVRYRTVLAVLDVIDTLSPYLFLIRSDIACIYRPDHPFLRQFFIKALRPVEILISYQLLRYLLFQLDAHPLTDSAKKSEQNLHVDISKRPNLYFLIVQLSGRILHPQGLYDVSDVSRLWVKCARYVSKSLSSECQEVSMPPPDYEKLMMDFTTKQIGLSLPADAFRVVDEEVPGADGFGNAFQSPHNNKLLRMGLFAELVHYCAGGVSDPSKDEPPNEWVYDTLPINNTSSIQDLSEVDYGYMLRLTYNIRRGVILHCRDILLNLLCDAGHIELMMSSLPFSLKMMIFHQLCHMQSIYRKNLVNKGDEYQAASLMEPGVQCNVTIALENVCFYMKKHFMREASSALTSCLRCLSCSFFQSSATKIIGNVLENTDLFSRHLLAAHLWIDYHRNSDYEVELCVSMMKVILSSLMFVESASIELSLLQLCRHALTRILNCAMGVEARCGIAHVHTELTELSLCKSFNDIRCRAVEQLLRERGNANSQYSELTRTVVYIASGLELLQRFTSSAWNLSSPVLPYSSVARTACKTPRPSSAAKIPAASAESEFLASFKPMSPRIVNIKAGSVDIELTQCLNRLHYTLFANKALNLSTDKGNATLIEVALSSQVLPLVNDSRRTHGANRGIVPAADLNHFEVIYRGTCMKITQAGLLPNCIYSVKYRLLYSFYCLKDASTDANSNTGGSATGTSMDSISGVTSWCDAVEFRTDFGNSGGMMHSNSLTNVSFAFDPLRCGPDILLGCDGQTASYAGDDSWSTVLGTHSFTTGIVAWNIRICQSSTAYIFVGAATSTADLHTFLGGCSQSWGFIGEQALYHNREKVKVYGDCFCAGDIVGVVLDLDAGTLSFAINGKLQGVAFEGVFGEFYPAVAFYSVGQEVEIMSEGYQATAANETGLIGCTPGYNNIGDCSLVMEYIMCLYSKYASLSWQLMEELTQQCNLFCNGLQHRVLSVSGKYILLNTDCENSIVLKNLEMKVGERYRTPCGVGCVLGTAYGRVWFRFGDVNKVGGPQVWYYTHQQIVHARGKGFYQKNSYQPWGSVHPAEPDTAFRYDVENMLEILAPGKWTCTMDAAILTYLHKLAKDLSKNGGLFSRKTVPVSPWDVPITVINSEFRHLQSKLGKIVMKNNELLRIWGISGPKRRAVVARIALLRHYNLLLENNMSLFINDSLGSSVDSSPTTNQHIVSLRRSYDDYHPLTTTLWALGSGGNSTAIGSYDSGGDRCTGTSTIAYKQRGSTTIVRSDGHVTWPLVELEWNFPAAAQSVLSSAPSAPTTPQFKYTLFDEVKLDHFWEIVLKSAIKAAKTEDDYDYPDDLPQVKLNRFKSFRAKEASEFLKIPGDDLLFSSLFCQLWAELRQHSQEKVRMIYAHSMDDGQSRAFKVKFESEGVDDYGGPYREIFQQICAELQAADPSSSGLGGSGIDNGSQKKKNTARTNCFIPLLCPIANWSYEGPIEPEPDNCEGFEHRYAYTLNPSCTSDVLMDLYKFLGQFIGMAIRSKITLEFSFPMVVWKSIVRDTLTQKDLIGFDADAYNFISSIGNSYESYCNPHDTEENKGVIREELLTMLQGVCWSCTRTDGEIVELIPNGKQLSVDIEDLPYFIQKYVECRLTESFVALEALRSGLMSVIPEAALSLLTGEELYLIVCGASTIDVERLKLNTEYDDDISPEDPHIIMFWEVLASFSEAEKSSYLRFVWARPTLPPNQMEFVQKMKIQSVGHDDSTVNVDNYLPKAHTCFFSLNLPKYSSKEVMAEKLRYAIKHCTEMDADFKLTDTDVVGWGDTNGV